MLVSHETKAERKKCKNAIIKDIKWKGVDEYYKTSECIGDSGGPDVNC